LQSRQTSQRETFIDIEIVFRVSEKSIPRKVRVVFLLSSFHFYFPPVNIVYVFISYNMANRILPVATLIHREYLKFIEYLYKPCSPVPLALFRILFGELFTSQEIFHRWIIF